MSKFLLSLALMALTGFSVRAGEQSAAPADHIKALSPELINQADRAFEAAIKTGGINTAAVALIKGGELVWAGYYGEQAPGVPASNLTQFNVASITKTLSTETILKLVDAGKLDLDESMAPYWVDPDIKDDPRHTALTPRMALTHTTGFPNWRFFLDDYKLALLNDPGTTYGYSGEGFKYVAKYTENRLGRSFEDLMKEAVFEPLGITHASLSARKANFANIAQARAEDGEVPDPYCRPGNKYCVQEGGYSAAGDLVITVEDYAKFLISVTKGTNYSADLLADRNRVQVTRPVRFCDTGTPGCPIAQGYGLGWVVVDTEDGEKLLWHGGSDWSVVSSAISYQGSGDAIIIFLNAPNKFAMDAMPGLIRVFDPGSPIIDQYELWAARE